MRHFSAQSVLDVRQIVTQHEPMAAFTIHANSTLMGIYCAETADGALDTYARDAGCDDFAAMAALHEQPIGEARAEMEVCEIDGVTVEVTSIERGDYTPGCVDADVVIRIGAAKWTASVTLYPDKGRPAVGRRHPLGTCGTPADVWASDDVQEAITMAEAAGLDVAGAVVHAVDQAARKAGL